MGTTLAHPPIRRIRMLKALETREDGEQLKTLEMGKRTMIIMIMCIPVALTDNFSRMSSLNLHTPLLGRHYRHLCFTDKETRTQMVQVTCPVTQLLSGIAEGGTRAVCLLSSHLARTVQSLEDEVEFPPKDTRTKGYKLQRGRCGASQKL